jgi:beta-glucosidase
VGFKGVVVSDWGAIRDRAAAVRVGGDLEMPGSSGVGSRVIKRALSEGRLSEEAVSRCAGRVVELLEKAKGSKSLRERSGARLSEEDGHGLAREAASRSVTLLKNDGILPLSGGGKVVVVGKGAFEPVFQGTGSSFIKPRRLDVFSEEVKERGVGWKCVREFEK